jgi:transcriptional regulator with XRE-family HTH domain
MAHWTSESAESFIRRVTFDFWTQIQKRMDALPLTQTDLAKIFEVSESAVSQTLNNSRNPTLRTLFNYAQAAKLKFAIVPYEDRDPDRGPVNSEIFTICWEKAGRPHTFGEVSKVPALEGWAFNSDALIVPGRKGRLLSKTYAITQAGIGSAWQAGVAEGGDLKGVASNKSSRIGRTWKMAEANQIIYTFKELATILVKDRDIHEGFWGIYVKFGIKAANVGETDTDLRPTALVPVLELGLQKFDELNNLSIDSAQANPVTGKGAKPATGAIGGLPMGKASTKTVRTRLK